MSKQSGPPKCKLCGHEHWSYQEHEFGGDPVDVKSALARAKKVLGSSEAGVMTAADLAATFPEETLGGKFKVGVQVASARLPAMGTFQPSTRPRRARASPVAADEGEIVIVPKSEMTGPAVEPEHVLMRHAEMSAAVAKGRPGRKKSGEPWKAAGVSRRTWFRQQKEKKGGHEAERRA